MRPLCNKALGFKKAFRQLIAVAAGLLLAAPAFAQTGTSPWENAVSVLQQAFTSTIARGLSLVAIVVAGLTFAFGEGGSKRVQTVSFSALVWPSQRSISCRGSSPAVERGTS